MAQWQKFQCHDRGTIIISTKESNMYDLVLRYLSNYCGIKGDAKLLLWVMHQ